MPGEVIGWPVTLSAYLIKGKTEDLRGAGTPTKDIATKLNMSAFVLYTELHRGQDGTRLPNQRRRCNANLAQLRVQQSLERRGRKAAKGESMSSFEKISAMSEALGKKGVGTASGHRPYVALWAANSCRGLID